jgi:hypothetical protein
MTNNIAFNGLFHFPSLSFNQNKVKNINLVKKPGWFSYREKSSKPLDYESYFRVKGTEINNFKYPYGTISKVGNIEKPIYTYDIYQCAALAIIDKDKHYLAHVEMHCPSEKLAQDIAESFADAGDDWQNKKIVIVPGTAKDTTKTVETIISALEKINPGLSNNVEFRHFEDKGKAYLVVHNGEVFASSYVDLGTPNREIKSVYGAGR